MDNKQFIYSVLEKKEHESYTNKGKNRVSEERIVDKYKTGEYRLVTEQARYPITILPDFFSDESLHPQYQRHKVWDNKKKSQLIESFIMNVPVPPVFLYETDYAKYEVMDGLQRISSIISFYKDEFILEGLEIWDELNNYKYSELPQDIQNAIDRRNLSAVILMKESSSSEEQAYELKRFVFSRLNSGGEILEDQEIRNAIFSGDFNDMIKKLAEDNSKYNEMWKFSSRALTRMENYEMILRFFTHLSAVKSNINGSLVNLQNEYATKSLQFDKKTIQFQKNLFEETISLVYSMFGSEAFKTDVKKRAHRMTYDAVMLSVAYLILENPTISKKLSKLSLESEKFNLIEKYNEDFNGKYTSINYITTRVNLITELIKANIKDD